MKGSKLTKNISEFLFLMRYWDWNYKLQELVVAAVGLVLLSGDIKHQAANVGAYLIYSIFLLSYGYVINSYVDREEDHRVGKNRLGDFSKRFILGLILILSSGTLVIPLFFNDFRITLISLLAFGLATLYSCNPVRFKERGLWGVFVAAVTQRLSFCIFFFLMPESICIVVFIFGWLILTGVMMELGHQRDDYENDVKTNTTTFANRVGVKTIEKILNFLIVTVFIYSLSALFWFSSQGIYIVVILLVFSHNAIFSTHQYLMHPDTFTFIKATKYNMGRLKEVDEDSLTQYTHDADGWLTKEEGTMLTSMAQKSSSFGGIVELGPWCSRSTQCLAEGVRNIKDRKVCFLGGNKISFCNQSRLEYISAYFKNRLKESGLIEHVDFFDQASGEVEKRWIKPISLLCIDGYQGFEGMRNDFLLWEKYLITGGHLVLYDTNQLYWPGPFQVVKHHIVNNCRYEYIKRIGNMTIAKKIPIGGILQIVKNHLKSLRDDSSVLWLNFKKAVGIKV